VERRIKEIGKKSQKDQKAKDYEERQLKIMEQNAMKAYMGDVYLNADFSSQFTELPEGYVPEGVAGPSAMPTVQTQADLQAEAKQKIKEKVCILNKLLNMIFLSKSFIFRLSSGQCRFRLKKTLEKPLPKEQKKLRQWALGRLSNLWLSWVQAQPQQRFWERRD
jgi:hypothetical protein